MERGLPESHQGKTAPVGAGPALSTSKALLAAVADTGAHLLVRVKNSRTLPVCARLPDGSYLSRMGPVEVRVLRCTITITTSAGRRSEVAFRR